MQYNILLLRRALPGQGPIVTLRRPPRAVSAAATVLTAAGRLRALVSLRVPPEIAVDSVTSSVVAVYLSGRSPPATSFALQASVLCNLQ